jgi:peptidoglycan/xylan/chitin deacetylase (PgdA/CDA1 family)
MVAIVIIGIILVFGTMPGLISNMALSKPSHKNKTLSNTPSISGSSSNASSGTVAGFSSGNKVVMIGFDDSYKTQLLYAKPILDQYGFKATFFEVCGWVGKNSERQTWQDVATLQKDGMDIESHTMTHAHLNSVSLNKLYYELGYPDNLGSDNKTVVDVVAKYYNLARSGSNLLMFLHCNGFSKAPPQSDCRTFLPDGSLSYANRYDIRSQSFDHIHSNTTLSDAQLFQQFVQRMNSQILYNKAGTINAFPIITYHNLTYSNQVYNELPSTIKVTLFAQMMKYLHDNGFKVLTMNQLGYDAANNILYLKNAAGYSTIKPASTT